MDRREGVKQYHGKCKDWIGTQTETGKIWEKMRDKVRSSIIKIKKKIVTWRLGRKNWHSKE